MISLQVNHSKLAEETDIAKSIIGGKAVVNKKFFHNYSKIYLSTNENIGHEPYIESLKDRKRVMSITGSGDQIINSILFGGEDITGVDISVFAKYYAALKIAALKSLTKEEYIIYVLGTIEYFPLSRKLYEKVRENLVEDARSFWDVIFEKYTEKQIFNSSFFRDFLSSHETFKLYNPYLHDDNFDKVKEMVDQANIQLIDYDILDINRFSFDKFDLILLSNVLDYLCDFLGKDIDIIKEFRNFFKKLPLKKDGVALAYNLTLESLFDTSLNRGKFTIFRIDDSFVQFVKNEIIIYQNKSKSLNLIGKK